MNEQVQEIRYLVGEAWKGTYNGATLYGNANVVQDPTGLSVYRSLKPGNAGNPLSDTNWWFCIIDLSSIKAESDRIAALNTAIAQDEALRVAAEQLRQQKEAQREAAETQRNEAEQARISAEQQRVSDFNAQMQQQQTAFQQAETARGTAYEQAEVGRNTSFQQAESARTTAFNNQMQQQQTAYTEAEAARDTAFDEAETERDAKVDEKVADITNLQAQIGYFVCDTAAATAAKTITATGYALTTGGNIRIKMTNANTANAVTLNINNTGAKALFYNGAQASSTNSWEAGEVVEVYYDGTQFQCQANKGGGSADDITFNNEKSHLVAENVQNAIDEVVPFTLHTMNDSITVKSGYRLVYYAEQAFNGRYVTDFIPVKEGVSYHLVCNGAYGNLVAGAFYREDKTGLQLLDTYKYGNNNDIVVTAPTGAKYIKLTSYTPYINIREIDETIGEKVLNQQYNLITYSLEGGSLDSNGEKSNSDSRYQHTNKIPMRKGDKFWIRQTNNQSGSGGGFFLFDTNEEIVDAYSETLSFPEYFTAPYDGYFRIGMCALNTGLKLSIDIRQLCATTAGKKKYMPKNIHTCGHSFWALDGATRSQFGVSFTIRGFQTIFKEQYIFDNFDNLPYDGHSLGAASASDTSSIALKLSSWTGNAGDIWTLDTVTNDFKRNIPIGTLDDYNNNTGATTYYGALRIFADKISELSGTSAIVIVSNATHRNNSGYTSTSTNTAGHTLTDYSNALSCIAVINGWNFVDAFNYGGIFDDNLAYTLLDGLHPNNLGYSLIAKEWLKVLDMIYNNLLS